MHCSFIELISIQGLLVSLALDSKFVQSRFLVVPPKSAPLVLPAILHMQKKKMQKHSSEKMKQISLRLMGIYTAGQTGPGPFPTSVKKYIGLGTQFLVVAESPLITVRVMKFLHHFQKSVLMREAW